MKLSLRHQSTGIVYPYLALAANLMVRGFFRKIYISNREALPTDKPVLLAANHPTAFADPCLLGIFLNPPLYNMTRGDVFRKPFFRKLMESINMFPVFRARDGFRGRDRNQEVFEFCEKKLLEKRVVTIYVEGEHHLEKHVRPIQKGILRIAFDTYEKHQLEELQILPAGCSYVWGDRPRDEAMVRIGAPIWVRDYWEDYQANPSGTMMQLASDIEAALKKVCLHIDDTSDAELLEQLLTLKRSEHVEHFVPIVSFNGDRFAREKAVCDALNELDASAKSSLQSTTSTYFKSIEKAGLTDEGLRQPKFAAWHWLLIFLVGLAPFIIGYLSSRPVVWFAKAVATKKVKKREFYSSVYMGTGFFGGILYYLAWFVGCLITLNPWWITFALLLPVLGWFSMIYREYWTRWTGARRALSHPDQQALLDLREKIPVPW
ncbi:MAG: 1-acyl-sn-glycerol-3-phosphate acyltransferase [Lewinellaceae bacterium]|nr:1-acyl-sn-glycerol-3-phosphate acyltransferase [Lewinellaceae bacterium]